jgi:uncharacterized protein YjbI with pentapeptide repeats
MAGAVLDQANFKGAALGGIKSTRAANFSSACISNCDFTQANAFGVKFPRAMLTRWQYAEGRDQPATK